MEQLRFDIYSVAIKGNDFHVVQLSKGVPTIVAQILAGVTHDDFVNSVVNTGWVGTCPQWSRHLPMVVMPKGEHLGTDQLQFMLEEMFYEAESVRFP